MFSQLRRKRSGLSAQVWGLGPTLACQRSGMTMRLVGMMNSVLSVSSFCPPGVHMGFTQWSEVDRIRRRVPDTDHGFQGGATTRDTEVDRLTQTGRRPLPR